MFVTWGAEGTSHHEGTGSLGVDLIPSARDLHLLEGGIGFEGKSSCGLDSILCGSDVLTHGSFGYAEGIHGNLEGGSTLTLEGSEGVPSCPTLFIDTGEGFVLALVMC